MRGSEHDGYVRESNDSQFRIKLGSSAMLAVAMAAVDVVVSVSARLRV